MDYRNRLEGLYNRQNPDSNLDIQRRMFSEDGNIDHDIERYVRRSMMAVDSHYTERTFEAGDMVKRHLQMSMSNVSYEYQGSVMTDTHIKGASDIDLLVLSEKFSGTEIDKVRHEIENTWKYSHQQLTRLENFNNEFIPYRGSCNDDLRENRQRIENCMQETYDICDISKPKAVRITNQNLHRDVDIVTASWFHSLDFVLQGQPSSLRGIKIFNKELGYAEGPDYPFLSIERINRRSTDTNGRLKRMIRFLKNVRTDADHEIDLSSFEINAICYSMPQDFYAHLEYKELVPVLWNYMHHLSSNGLLGSLKSVVGDEYVFAGKADKVNAYLALESEVLNISNDLYRL